MIRLTRALRSLHLRHAIAFLLGAVDRFLLPVWAELEEEARLSGGMIGYIQKAKATEVFVGVGYGCRRGGPYVSCCRNKEAAGKVYLYKVMSGTGKQLFMIVGSYPPLARHFHYFVSLPILGFVADLWAETVGSSL